MRTNVWGAPQGIAKHRFPRDSQLQIACNGPEKTV